MDEADALLRDGDLDGARSVLIARAKAAPGDARTRMFLFQLFALVGEWDKARTQLDTLARLSPEAQMLATAYGQAIDGERQRAIALAGIQPVAVLAHGGAWIDDLAAALGHLGRDEHDLALERRDAALDAAPDTPGTLEADGDDAVAFDWIADLDPWFGPCCEAIVAGRWGLMPFDAVESITSAGASDLRDTIWFPAQIRLRAGASVAALLPARYPRSDASPDVRHRLGTATDWSEAGRGIGQHVLATSDGSETGLLALRRLRFDDPS